MDCGRSYYFKKRRRLSRDCDLLVSEKKKSFTILKDKKWDLKIKLKILI